MAVPKYTKGMSYDKTIDGDKYRLHSTCTKKEMAEKRAESLRSSHKSVRIKKISHVQGSPSPHWGIYTRG